MNDSRFFRRYMDILNEEQYDPETQRIIDALRPPPGYTGPGMPSPSAGQGGQTDAGQYDPEVQAIIDKLRPQGGAPQPGDIERLDLPDGRIIYFDKRSSVELRGGGTSAQGGRTPTPPAPGNSNRGGQQPSGSSTSGANNAIRGNR